MALARTLAPENIVFYDEQDDSLTFIHKAKSVVQTISTGFVLISLDEIGCVVALEFMGAIKNFRIAKEVLTHLRTAEVLFASNQEKNLLVITVNIFSDEGKAIINTTTNHTPITSTHSFKSVACS
jgi:uncharacterized protein YuzE